MAFILIHIVEAMLFSLLRQRATKCIYVALKLFLASSLSLANAEEQKSLKGPAEVVTCTFSCNTIKCC